MKIHEINLHNILKNDKFRFTSPGFSEELKKSLSIIGVTNPIYLISKKNNYQILSGFKRFYCSNNLNLKTIPAKIIRKEKTYKIFQGLLLEHISLHPLNLIEKSRILNIIKNPEIFLEKQRKKILKTIGIPEKTDIINKILKLIQLPIEVQKYIEQYDISLKQTEIFWKIDSDLIKLFVKIANELSIRIVELEQIITLYEDIAGKESLSFYKIFTDLKIDTILKNDNLSRNQKIKLIKEKLQQRRFPKLVKWNNKLEMLQQKLKFPGSTHITWDRSLENPGIILNINIESTDDIDKFMTYFSTQEVKKNITKMLEIV